MRPNNIKGRRAIKLLTKNPDMHYMELAKRVKCSNSYAHKLYLKFASDTADRPVQDVPDLDSYPHGKIIEDLQPTPAKEHPALSGGSNDYYKVRIVNPTSGAEPYIAECNDIIEGLGMNYAEGNAFKAVWRRAALRNGGGKPGSTVLYESEKVEFFGKRLVQQAMEV